MLGERTIFSFLHSILPLAPCHCHTSNTIIKHIPKHFPDSSPHGRSSQLFSSTLLFSYSPGTSLGKQTPRTAFWWGEITLVPGRFQQNATAVFDIGKARAESISLWILALVLAELGLILKQPSMYLTMLWGTILQLPNVHQSVMLKNIYPLLIQHSQPPSLGSCPSLFKRRKKLLWKLPQHFFLFETKHFCINA